MIYSVEYLDDFSIKFKFNDLTENNIYEKMIFESDICENSFSDLNDLFTFLSNCINDNNIHLKSNNTNIFIELFNNNTKFEIVFDKIMNDLSNISFLSEKEKENIILINDLKEKLSLLENENKQLKDLLENEKKEKTTNNERIIRLEKDNKFKDMMIESNQREFDFPEVMTKQEFRNIFEKNDNHNFLRIKEYFNEFMNDWNDKIIFHYTNNSYLMYHIFFTKQNKFFACHNGYQSNNNYYPPYWYYLKYNSKINNLKLLKAYFEREKEVFSYVGNGYSNPIGEKISELNRFINSLKDVF
jgi:hypothetical protein